MLIIDAREREVEVAQKDWPLAADLFLKWGHKIEGSEVHVIDVDDFTPELSAWGIPWKRIKWN